MPSRGFKKGGEKRVMSSDIGEETTNIIARIEDNPGVVGILYIRNNLVRISTVPESMVRALAKRLPPLSYKIHQAVTEIDIQDELIAYRIETMAHEILVAAGPEFTACVLHAKKNKGKRK